SKMTEPQPFCRITRSESFGAVSKWVHTEHEKRWRLHQGMRMKRMSYSRFPPGWHLTISL
ncbi:hypothetical protein J6590_080979, partial [Homalodisca vitripennis]